jgi:hypothetical protein
VCKKILILCVIKFYFFVEFYPFTANGVKGFWKENSKFADIGKESSTNIREMIA